MGVGMKEPWEWTEEDLQALIDSRRKEDLFLDYKRSESLGTKDHAGKDRSQKRRDDISKDVSAFANSGGGALVYGIPEDPNSHSPMPFDDGINPAEVTVETLDQLITDSIAPRVPGVRITPVPLNKARPGRVAYVIYVPQSMSAPHQAADDKYYHRSNTRSFPMKHYQFDDVRRRQTTPDLHMDFKLVEGPSVRVNFIHGQELSSPVQMNVYISNDSEQPAENVLIKLYVIWYMSLDNPAGMERLPNEPLVGERDRVEFHVFQRRWMSRNDLPIFRSIPFELTNGPVSIAINSHWQNRSEVLFPLGYRIYAPGMNPREGYKVLRLAYNRLTIQEGDHSEDDIRGFLLEGRQLPRKTTG
jgi:hypothetical protein